jgi:hypothetical protein
MDSSATKGAGDGPAIRRAVAGIDAYGPLAPDAAFIRPAGKFVSTRRSRCIMIRD